MDEINELDKVKKRRGHRRKHVPPLRKRGVCLTDEQVALLRKWGKGDVSAGLRWLIDAAALLIVRTDEAVTYQVNFVTVEDGDKDKR